MKHKINKSILLSLASVSAVTLISGSVFAKFVVTSAPTIGVRISVKEAHTVTYYLPTSESASTYEEHTTAVLDGASLYDALSSEASAVGAYSFESWHLDNDSDSLRKDGADYAKNLVDINYKVKDDVTVYAKYTQSNVGYYYDTANRYVTSGQNNLTINASNFYYGDRIYSLDGVEGAGIDLTSSSGIYNLTKNTNDWSVLRQVTVNLSNVTWWTSDGAKHGIYCATDDNSLNEWVTPTYTSNKYTFSVNAAYTKFVVVRYKNTSPVNTGFDTNNIWNQTVDTFLTGTGKGSNVYGSANGSGGTKCYELWIESDTVDGKNNYSWWHS